MTRIRIAVNLGIAFSFLCFQACSKGEEGRDRPESADPAPKVRSVKVVTIKAQPLKRDVEYVGTLSAHLKVNLATESGGTIESLSFEKGARVRKGQILAKISAKSARFTVQQADAVLALAESNLRKLEHGSRPEEIRMAEASVDQAEAALNEAENNFKRISDLHETHSSSRSEYDSAKRGLETARANAESARQQLEISRQGPRVEDREAARAGVEQARAALSLARDRLQRSVLRSPCDGIIAFRNVEQGEVLGPGTIITRILDNSSMKISLSMGERDLMLLDRQKEFLFRVDAIPGKEFTCRLAFLSPTADPNTRSFPLELSVAMTDPMMADGMTVRVRFPLKNHKESIKIPSAWLSEQGGDWGLFVAEEGRAVFKRVRLGSYYEQNVEILEGLKDNDLIITNHSGLKNGDLVKHE